MVLQDLEKMLIITAVEDMSSEQRGTVSEIKTESFEKLNALNVFPKQISQ